MKKLLGLLVTITIVSSAMPIVIATSSYQKIEKLNITKRENKNNDNLEKTKIVIKTNGSIVSSGVVLNNKLYFGSTDKNIYEYDPATNTQKVVIKTEGEVWSSGVVLNNKLYIASHRSVYEYDPVTLQQKIVITTEDSILSSGVVLNNKLYFGSYDNNVYEYDPLTEQQKIVIKANDKIYSSGVVLNNKLYFGSSDKNVYEYDPVTLQQKVVITTNGSVWSSGVVLNNKIYFGIINNSNGDVYEYDPVTEQQKAVIKKTGAIYSSGVVLNNKLYFGSWDHNVYEYDPVTLQQKVIIRTKEPVWSSGVVLNNKLYIGSYDYNVYEYDPTTNQQKIVITTDRDVRSSGVVLNNKLYFGSDDHKVYEYDPNYYNLRQINNNSDILILNELNYLNPYLDITKLEVINKTNNSAIIKAKNNLNNNIKLKIHYSIDNNQNKVINLNQLIKKAIFFKFRDENITLFFKEIKNINIDNLNFKNIEITRNNKLKWGVNFKNVCFDQRERRNNSVIIKLVKIPKCDYNQKSKIMFQVTKGISKNNQNNTKNGWTLNVDDENKLNDFVNVNYRDQKIKNTLSNEFYFANLNLQNKEIIFVFNESEVEIELTPNEKVTISYSVRENKYEAILNLKQKITGIISIKKNNLTIKDSIDNFNEEQIITLTIKEAMQILQKYSLLPDEITINEDNSITFNGQANILRISESKPKLILKTEII